MYTFIYLALWMTGFYTVYCNLWGQIMPYFVNSNINVEKYIKFCPFHIFTGLRLILAIEEPVPVLAST